MDKKKISLVILFVVLISAILTIFLLPKTAKTPTKTPTPTPTQISEKLCGKFQQKDGEISCQYAIDIALNLYNGTVTDITLADNFRTSAQLTAKETGINAWRIAVMLNEPVEENGEKMKNVRITLDRTTGKVIRTYFFN